MEHQSIDVVEMSETFAAVARSLARSGDAREALDEIVRLAVISLDACEFAGISFADGSCVDGPFADGPAVTSATEGQVPRILDAIQTEVGEGPAFDVLHDEVVAQTGDLATESRWPTFSQRAHAETGIDSILALRLFVGPDVLGSLNLYATAPDAFDDSDVALGAVFAAHAAVALAAVQREEHLERKADGRDLIGRAKGILMAREGITDDEAFARLRRASQHLNRKVSHIAEAVDLTGEIPTS